MLYMDFVIGTINHYLLTYLDTYLLIIFAYLIASRVLQVPFLFPFP